MTILPNLSPEDRLKAALQFQREATPENKAALMALPGGAGDSFKVEKVADNQGRPPRGWENPRVIYGKTTGLPEQIYSPPIPETLPEAEALADTLELLNAMVPEGYRARIAECRLNTSGWNRKLDPETGTGTGDAYTGPVRFYKWVVEEIPEVDEVLAGMSEEAWNAARDAVAKRKYKVAKTVDVPHAVDLFVPHGDLQAGQHDGDSVEGMIARMSLYPIIVKAEIKRLKKAGTPVKRLVCPSLGDLVEGTLGFYSNSLWLVKLNNKKQRLVARRLIQAMLEELATIGLPILVPVVPGNHGENRNSKGKILTDTSDNSDLEVMEVVAEILRQNPTLKDQIEFRFVEDGHETLTIDLGWGYGVGFTHGHLSGHGSGHPAQKMLGYLKSQAMAEQAIGRARYVVSGHFHSAMYCTMPGNKVWIQIPALCAESDHFVTRFGLNGGPGIITFTMGPEGLSNWMNHKVPMLSTVEDDIAEAEAAVVRAAKAA